MEYHNLDVKRAVKHRFRQRGIVMSNPSRQKKSRRGTAYCEVCNKGIHDNSKLVAIKVGEWYRIFCARYRKPRVRCDAHEFRRSDLAQGRNSDVYLVFENLEDWCDGKSDMNVRELLIESIQELESSQSHYSDGADNIENGLEQQVEQMQEFAMGIGDIVEELQSIREVLGEDTHIYRIKYPRRKLDERLILRVRNLIQDVLTNAEDLIY